MKIRSKFQGRLKILLIIVFICKFSVYTMACEGDLFSQPSWNRLGDTLKSDFTQTYSSQRLISFVGVLTFSAFMANSPLDEKFNTYFHNNIHGRWTVKMGNLQDFTHKNYIVPILLGGLVVDFFNVVPVQSPFVCSVGLWTERVLRGVTETLAPMYALQVLIGSTRPKYDKYHGSYWHPVNRRFGSLGSHGVSGDAYIGSLLMVTAAGMTEKVPFKVLWYTVSFLPALGRIDSQSHYFSQVFLGWTLGYLTAVSIAQSSLDTKKYFTTSKTSISFHIMPVPLDDGAMVMINIAY